MGRFIVKSAEAKIYLWSIRMPFPTRAVAETIDIGPSPLSQVFRQSLVNSEIS